MDKAVGITDRKTWEREQTIREQTIHDEGRQERREEGDNMLKVFGADICKDCLVMKRVFGEQKVEFEYVSITDNTANLRAFLAIRDTEPLYEGLRSSQGGGIGIPLFIKEGKMTFDMNEVLEGLGKTIISEEEYEELVKQCWEEYSNAKET